MVSAFFCVISNLVRNVKEKYWSFDAKCDIIYRLSARSVHKNAKLNKILKRINYRVHLGGYKYNRKKN